MRFSFDWHAVRIRIGYRAYSKLWDGIVTFVYKFYVELDKIARENEKKKQEAEKIIADEEEVEDEK